MKEITQEEAVGRLQDIIKGGMSQNKLAAKLGVSSTYLGLVLTGKYPPTASVLEPIGIEKRTETRYIDKEGK